MSGFLHTLRFRLAAWCALVLMAVLLACGWLLYGAVRFDLLRHHDAALQAAALSVERVLSQEPDCERLTPRQREELDGTGHVVLLHEVEGERRVLYRSPDSVGTPIPFEAARAIRTLPPEGGFETIAGQAAPLRLYSRPYRSRAGRHGIVHVAQPLGDVEAPLLTLRLALLLMAPVAALASALGGYWLAGRALGPVDQVIRQAREIEATRLSRRLPAAKAPDEIGRLVDTLNQMFARLEASFEGMKRFTADASHELRGPLATMRGAIDVALDRPRETSEYRDVLQSLGEDVGRLRSIVEDLLVLARADSGRVALEKAPVRIDVIAAEVAESFLPAAHARGLKLLAECREAVVVEGDERWLRQLVANLVDNAVKFSTGGDVRIEVTGGSGEATLAVVDSGPGIPEETLDRIFDRFYRGDTSRTYGGEGVGLGLSIARWIAEAHGGTIRVRNQASGGSRFTVRIPLARPGVSPAAGGERQNGS